VPTQGGSLAYVDPLRGLDSHLGQPVSAISSGSWYSNPSLFFRHCIAGSRDEEKKSRFEVRR
jgi:hypothetical protein